jgi:hypothetical protein
MNTQIHRKAIAIAAAVMLGITISGDAALARSYPDGGFHGGPYIGGSFSTPPIFNPSSGYTVPTSPETPVSPASPGSVFH